MPKYKFLWLFTIYLSIFDILLFIEEMGEIMIVKGESRVVTDVFEHILIFTYLFVDAVDVTEDLLIFMEVLRKFTKVFLCLADVVLHHQIFLNSFLFEHS